MRPVRTFSFLAAVVVAGSIALGASADAATPQAAPAAASPLQVMDLIGFNGAYNLTGTSGGFVLIDAVMSRSVNKPHPSYTVSLVVSLDGATSSSTRFTGTFDGSHLRQRSANGMSLDLTFAHRIHGLGPTARVSGQVTLPGGQPTTVQGTTYDNPIPADFWGGQTFYLTPPTGKKVTPVARIAEDGNLYYDYGRGTGKLTLVPEYTYDLDMYYFAFPVPGGATASFIMGTSGAQGFAMNNLTEKDSEPISTRNLTTVPLGKSPASKNWYPDFHLTQGATSVSVGSDTTLADFSAYYPIDVAGDSSSRAFFSVAGSTLSLLPGIADTVPGASASSLYSALLTVSFDGTSTRSWYFDRSKGMTFDGRTLRMPRQHVELTFTRRFDAATGSVFWVDGTIDGRHVSGSSPFNPVPITAFAATMKDVSGANTVTISPSGAVTLNGLEIPNYEYVPSMYIVAGPIPGTTGILLPVTLLSLGHAGASGMSAIVTTDYGTGAAKTFNVYQIPPS